MDTVSFTRMEDGTAEDWALIESHESEFFAALPDRILAALEKLKDSFGGYQVTRYTHSLQAATRALRDGRDEEYVVAALVHDIGDDLAPYTHGEMVAAVLKPFVREELCWMVKHHGVFQLRFFSYLSEEDRNRRDRWRDHRASISPRRSASGTTRPRSIRATTRCRSASSSRWCGGSSPSPATSSPATPRSGRAS